MRAPCGILGHNELRNAVNDFDKIGGMVGLTQIMTAFVQRERDDFIIGFLFEGRDLGRIIAHETSFAARHLGADVSYEGRPLREAHAPLKINKGHFRRRIAILRTVLEEYGVEDAVIRRWVEHDKKLEPLITDGTDCL